MPVGALVWAVELNGMHVDLHNYCDVVQLSFGPGEAICVKFVHLPTGLRLGLEFEVEEILSIDPTPRPFLAEDWSTFHGLSPYELPDGRYAMSLEASLVNVEFVPSAIRLHAG